MVTTYNSNMVTNQTGVLKDPEPMRARVRYFEGVTATADTGTLNLVKLPPGKVRIVPFLSGFLCANMANDANVSVGLGAYTAANGTAVAADTAILKAVGFANACTLANSKTILGNVANGGLLVDSMTGVAVTATVADANTVEAGTFSGWIWYTTV